MKTAEEILREEFANNFLDLEYIDLHISAMEKYAEQFKPNEQQGGVNGSLPFPDGYENVKDSYLDFIETAMMIDIKMQPMSEIVDKIGKATDKFAKYLLRQ